MSANTSASASASKKASSNLATVIKYISQQIRANPSKLQTNPEYEPLRKIFEDALLKDPQFAADLRLALKGYKISSSQQAAEATTSTGSTAAAAAAASSSHTAISPSSAAEQQKKKRKRTYKFARVNYGAPEVVEKLKTCIFDWDNKVGSAVDSETGKPLDIDTFCDNIGFKKASFMPFIDEDRTKRRIPGVKIHPPPPKRPKKDARKERKTGHFASPSYSAKNKRTNWSLPENIERMRKAVHDWENKTGDRIDGESGKLLSLPTFSKKVGIPMATLAGYVQGDKSKRKKVGCHVGGDKNKPKSDPFSKEDAELCVDMLKRAEKAGRKKSRAEAIEYVKMLRPDYKQAQASRILDAHVLSKNGEDLIVKEGGKDEDGDNEKEAGSKGHAEDKDEREDGDCAAVAAVAAPTGYDLNDETIGQLV